MSLQVYKGKGFSMDNDNVMEMTKDNIEVRDGQYNTNNCKTESHSFPKCHLEAIIMISSLSLFIFRKCVGIWCFKLCEHFISEVSGRTMEALVLQVNLHISTYL